MPGVFLRNLCKHDLVHGAGKMTGPHQLRKDNKTQLHLKLSPMVG